MKTKSFGKHLKVAMGVMAMAGIIGCGNNAESDEYVNAMNIESDVSVNELNKIDITGENGADSETFEATEDVNDIEITDNTEKIIDCSVAADLAIKMLKAGEGENKLVSPLSVMMAMGMATNGANGETKDQLLKALNVDQETLDRDMTTLLATDDNDGQQLTYANGIWANGIDKLNDDYVVKMSELYKAEIHGEDFGPDTVTDINSFVDKNTNGQIKKLIDSLDKSASMVLVDALCFNGEWDSPFEDYQIKEDYDFNTVDGQIQKVTMLNGDSGQYITVNDAEGFTYSYAGGKYSFIALLPKEGEAPDKFISGLDGKTLMKAYDDREFTEVIFGIPEFEFDYNMDLCEMLKGLGVVNAFDSSSADFTGMFKENIGQYISKIVHKTHIELDREGTRAAAATGMVTLDAAPPSFEEPKEIILDRPFVYIIFDNDNEIPVFMGQVDSFE